MSEIEFALLCGIALLTAVLSAVVGMAGGITLLSAMLLLLDPLVAIPIHGVVQMVSNGSRTWIQREHVDWPVLWRYAALLLPMGFAGLWLARALPPTATRCLIGAFVLLATWTPHALLLGVHPERADAHRRFLALGAVVGVLNPTIGATGPLIAPFFLNIGLTRHQLIGTKAACQMAGHVAKIAVFGVAGFAYGPYAMLLLAMSACVIVGTWIGSRLLDRVSELWFTRLYKSVLTLIALRLFVWEGLDLLGLRG